MGKKHQSQPRPKEAKLREVRISCSVPTDKASDGLLRRIRQLGIAPIVTPQVIRAVYQGPSRVVGETLMEIFELERDHEITTNLPPHTPQYY